MKKILILLGTVAAGLMTIAAVNTPTTDEVSVEQFFAIDLAYGDQRWRLADEVTIFPCNTTLENYQGGSQDPHVYGYDASGKRIFDVGQRNQRIIYIEDPKTPAGLLNTVNFQLRVPVMAGLAKVEYWERPDIQKDPSLSIDVSKAPVNTRIECLPPSFTPDALSQR